MPYPSRTPSIKLDVDIDTFNNLIERLTINETFNDETNNLSINARYLKEKLLTYSVPKTDENGETTIYIKFFPTEASSMIVQLMMSDKPTLVKNDYYSVLLRVREERKNQKNNY